MLTTRNAIISFVVLCLIGLPFFTGMGDHLLLNLGLSVTPAHAQTGTYEALKGEPGQESFEQIADPLESMNRVFFKFNDKLYFWILRPVAIGYKTVMPENLRIPVDNAFYNVKFPVRFVNCLLQGKLVGAGTEMASFVINSTIGFGGMFEPAQKEFHLKRYKEDFGQTLGVYGMPPIIYINWPVLGPSNVRDSLGRGGDYFLNPVNWLVSDWGISAGIRAGEGINELSLHLGEYEDFKKSALDPYVSMRSAYYQYRENQIRQ
jgi:phospholipid-binding lipoprotein MlaA